MNRRVNVTSLRPIVKNYMKTKEQMYIHKINIDKPANRRRLSNLLTRNQISAALRLHEEIARLINEINRSSPNRK